MNEILDITDLDNVEQSAITKLNKDLRSAATMMSRDEARFLVDTYYSLQNNRIREKNRLRQLGDEPSQAIAYFSDNFYFLEKQVPKMLQLYCENDFVGRWLLSICGIGPVLAAGLLAHIDLTKKDEQGNYINNNAGQVLAFGGMAGFGQKWEKGQKRPWNATLKVLFWKAGESFIKVQSRDADYYGKVYASWKQTLTERNERGKFAQRAAQCLAEKKYGKETEAYKAYSTGRLPLAHIHAMARRKAIGLFVSHLWEVMFRHQFPDRQCRKPYAIDKLGHETYIPIHNDPFK